MKLSREEEDFLRHWMHDEVHYREGTGPAKRLQVERAVAPAELAERIIAAIPDPAEQWAAAEARPTAPPVWPWSEEQFRHRLAEARAALESSRPAPERQAQAAKDSGQNPGKGLQYQ